MLHIRRRWNVARRGQKRRTKFRDGWPQRFADLRCIHSVGAKCVGRQREAKSSASSCWSSGKWTKGVRRQRRTNHAIPGWLEKEIRVVRQGALVGDEQNGERFEETDDVEDWREKRGPRLATPGRELGQKFFVEENQICAGLSKSPGNLRDCGSGQIQSVIWKRFAAGGVLRGQLREARGQGERSGDRGHEQRSIALHGTHAANGVHGGADARAF